MNIFIILICLLVLGFIFVRKYLSVQMGLDLKKFFFRPKNILHHFHFHDREKFEVTVDEMLPDKDKSDPKKAAKAAILYKKAETDLEKGDLRNAQKILIQVIALDPSSIEAYNKLGLIYLRQNQFCKAENIYRKLILSAANDPAFFSNLGLALYSQKKLEEAKGYYKKAIEIDGTRAGRFFSLGQIFHELGEVEAAMDHLKKAVQMEPRNLDYLLSLADFYSGKQMIEEAKQLLGEILILFPNNEMAKEMREGLG